MYKISALLACFLFLSACSSTSNSNGEFASNSNDRAEVSDNDGVVCRYEKTVGSNMKRKVCRTAEERNMQREAAREGMLRLQRGSETNGS